MHVVYEAENLIDAHLLRGRLQGEGVDAFVRGEHLAGAMGELPVSGLIAVCVTSADLERTYALLEEWRVEDAAGTTLDDSAPDDSGQDAERSVSVWPTFLRA